MIGFRTLRVVLVLSMLLLAGCDGLESGASSPGTSTETSVYSGETPRDISTATETGTPTESDTPTSSKANWPRESKYRYFADHYEEDVDQYIDISSVTVHGEAMHVKYVMDNPDNKSRVRQESGAVLIRYSSLAKGYTDGKAPWDETWVPKQLNVTQVAPNEEEYFYSHTNYTLALQYENEEIRYFGYYTEYINAGDHGPAWSTYND